MGLVMRFSCFKSDKVISKIRKMVSKMYLILDVGGTNIKYSCYDKGQQKIDSGVKSTPRDNYTKFLSEVIAIVQTVATSYEIDGVGISLPGQVNSETGIINRGGTLLFLDQKNIVKDLSEIFPFEIKIENDGKAAVFVDK